MKLSPLKVGVISDSALQRHSLQSALSSYGLELTLTCAPDVFEHQSQERISSVSCWIIDLENEELDIDALMVTIEATAVPVLFGLGLAPNKNDLSYISWERRLFGKLEDHFGNLMQVEAKASLAVKSSGKMASTNLALTQTSRVTQESNSASESPRSIAKEIWVLAASLGGPAAVKEFLDELPESVSAGFLYAQHVDVHFSNVLLHVLGRHANLALLEMSQHAQIRAGEVLVVPVDREVSFAATGLQLKNKPWRGPYGPSIDQLLENLFEYYGVHCHVIFFSGMGNDGSAAIPRMASAGCKIWTQRPDSCANGSMPQAVIDLDCSEKTGTPKELAHAFLALSQGLEN